MAMTTPGAQRSEIWPSLPLEAWSDTYATLHRWIQIVGKIRLAQSPWVNHSWHVTLYVTATGLTTSAIPYGERTFQIDFDFVDHELIIRSSDGRAGGFALEPQSVASFYARLMAELARLELPVRIHPMPNEVPDPVRFDQDEAHCAYDRVYANRFWRVLVQADRVFNVFRARFVGKCSAVHLFWGALDLAVTRFSGRPAPEHPGGIPNMPDWVTREAYSHEVASCGFWPGGGSIAYPVVLCVRVSGACRIRDGESEAGRSVLQPGLWRIRSSVRCGPPITVAGCDAARISPDDLRSRGGLGKVGPQGPGKRARSAARRLRDRAVGRARV